MEKATIATRATPPTTPPTPLFLPSVGCIPLTPAAIGRRRRLSAQPINAANPELVTTIVASVATVQEASPSTPVAPAVFATGVIKESSFAVPADSLSPAVTQQLQEANSQPAQCSTGLTGCSGACVDVLTDVTNCGACGNACAAPTLACTAGVCSCGAGLTACSGACVDLQTDNANCGACGNACLWGSTCVAGSCTCSDISVTALGATHKWYSWDTVSVSGNLLLGLVSTIPNLLGVGTGTTGYTTTDDIAIAADHINFNKQIHADVLPQSGDTNGYVELHVPAGSSPKSAMAML